MGKEFNYAPALKQLIKTVKKNNKKAKISLIKKAFNFAKNAHSQQKRRSGEEYFSHPFSIALMLAGFGLDTESICAALLHDVLEDTKEYKSRIQKEFGNEICSIVDSLTKIKLIVGKHHSQRKSQDLQKILLASTRDVRVLVIKLADKLHNMRTIQFLPKKKQLSFAQDVLDVYVPLAHKLGVHIIKHELADLAFPIVKPKIYHEIEKKIIVEVHKDEKGFLNAVDELKKSALRHKIKAYVYLRHKSPFTVYKKMQQRMKSFDEIYDYVLINVMVESVPECYEMLGITHNLFSPLPMKLKDYIAIPEPNLYQAIHTTVLNKKGKKIKLYIMTKKMAESNKLGIIALLKENISKKELKQKIGFLNNLSKIDKQTMLNPEFIHTIRTDFLGNKMFVFSSSGEIIELPSHSTPLDYAFNINLQNAGKAKNALVNGRLVSLSHNLSPGDIVEIIPSKTRQLNRNWLKMVKSETAKTKLRQLLKRNN